MISSKEKESYFSQPITDITGSAADPRKHIFQLGEDEIMFRYAEFDTGRGGEPIEILHSTDFHLNCLNARDCIEQLPCIKSTREFRLAFRDGSTVPNAMRTMKVSEFFDQTVITGDTLDYITWGTFDLMEEIIWNANPNVLVSLGGHDITRVMQGKVPDDTTRESRYEILKKFWRHDVYYASRVLGDKVRVVVLNNGQGEYFDFQAQKLEADILDAKARGHIVLIFQHEPICTHNEKETDVEPIRVNDGSGSRNFCDGFIGNASSNEETMRTYKLIIENADVVKGVFCGHWHSDFYTEIVASYINEKGEKTDAFIPQYVLTGNMYDKGHALIIKVK